MYPRICLHLVAVVLSAPQTSINAQETLPLTQRADSSIILEAHQAESKDRTLSWTIDIQHPGTYVLQLVSDLEESKDPLSASFSIDDELKGQQLKKVYIIEDGMVSEFAEPVVLERGQHQLSLNPSLSASYARLVPHGYPKSRIFLSSQKYYDQWLEMHQSAEKVAAMEWYKNARFGMFIHWGVYSKAAGLWNGTKIEEGDGPKVAEWLMFAFKIPRSEYEAYAQNFVPEESFAENFVNLAKQTGMKYMVITSKHHDGFALFDSEHSDLDIADATDYDGNLIKELYDACRAEGLDFGVYYSHGNDWGEGSDGNYANVRARNDQYDVPTRPNGKNLWDPSPNSHLEYLENKAYPQIAELIEMLPDLRLIWFDGDGLITEEQAFSFYKMVYEMNPNIVVNRRIGWDFGDYVDAGDNKTPAANELAAKHFETCGTANHSWGYKAYDHQWKTPHALLRNFLDIVSKGGNYLLNIGPDGSGNVPEPCVENFHKVGEWVQTNSEALFGTERWTVFNEAGGKPGTAPNRKGKADPTEFWFSKKGDKIYAMSLAISPTSAEICSLGRAVGEIKEVRLLGSDQTLEWSQESDLLRVDLGSVTTGTNGYALEITF